MVSLYYRLLGQKADKFPIKQFYHCTMYHNHHLSTATTISQIVQKVFWGNYHKVSCPACAKALKPNDEAAKGKLACEQQRQANLKQTSFTHLSPQAMSGWLCSGCVVVLCHVKSLKWNVQGNPLSTSVQLSPGLSFAFNVGWHQENGRSLLWIKTQSEPMQCHGSWPNRHIANYNLKGEIKYSKQFYLFLLTAITCPQFHGNSAGVTAANWAPMDSRKLSILKIFVKSWEVSWDRLVDCAASTLQDSILLWHGVLTI